MDVIEQKDQLMSPSDTPDKKKVSPLTAPYRKDFSLSSGAKFLGIAKTTLKRAVERGDVKATKNAAGHYTIEGAQIFQYQQNLEADKLREQMNQGVTSSATGSAPSGAPSSDTALQKGSAPSSVTPTAPVSADAPVTPSRFEEISVLKAENAGLKARIEVTERMYTDYKTMAEEAFKRLPAPMQPETPDVEVTPQSQTPRSKAPIAVVVALVVAASAVAFALYPDTVRGLLEGQGAPVADAVILEVVPAVTVAPQTDNSNPPR